MCVTRCLACAPESSQDTSEKGRADPSCSHAEAATQPLTAHCIPTWKPAGVTQYGVASLSVRGVVRQVAALTAKRPSNGFVPPPSKTRCVKPNRLANSAQEKSAEASPLKACGGLGRGVKMTGRSIVRAGCHGLGHPSSRAAGCPVCWRDCEPRIGTMQRCLPSCVEYPQEVSSCARQCRLTRKDRALLVGPPQDPRFPGLRSTPNIPPANFGNAPAATCCRGGARSLESRGARVDVSFFRFSWLTVDIFHQLPDGVQQDARPKPRPQPRWSGVDE